MPLRPLTWLVSLALHGAAASYLLVSASGAALEEGTGEDRFVVEQGLALDSAAKPGEAMVTTPAVDTEPAQLSEARPAFEEVRAVELKEETQIISSNAGPEQEAIREAEPEPVEQPVPPQVAAIEQPENIQVEEQRSASEAKKGGSATEKSTYMGQISRHLDGKKVRPKSRQSGTVIVRFTIDARGQVLSSEIAKSSGSKVLDAAALASIAKASPFPPMPEGWSGEPFVITVPFMYRVN